MRVVIAGAGLSGATIARKLTDLGHEVVVYEREEIGGHCADEYRDGINIHKYGPHIWHNSDKEVQDFVERFTEFNGYVHKCKANYNGKIYSFPPNLSTFTEIYGTTTIDGAKWVDLRKLKGILFDEYVLKQWGETPPKRVTNRIPIRYTYNDRYYNDRWEGIPVHGYGRMIRNMLNGIEVKMGDYLWSQDNGDYVIYTGAIDEFFDYKFGPLKYRSLKFDHKKLDIPDYQGIAHMSFTSGLIPFTRIVEHKHFHPVDVPHTWITEEYSVAWEEGMKRFYPMFDKEKYNKYASLATPVIFAGRLGKYQYLDMNKAVRQALDLAKRL